MKNILLTILTILITVIMVIVMKSGIDIGSLHILGFQGIADENQKLKKDAQPIDGIVRYYARKSSCYLNDEKVKTIDWGDIKSVSGFINYNILVKSAEENGLIFNGPKTFEEFKEHILVGEPFEISITASLKPKEKETQYTKTK